MRRIKSFLALLCLFMSGCAQLLVEKPIGTDYNPDELNEFEGIWIVDGPKTELTVVHLEKRNDKGLFKIGHIEWNSKARHYELSESDLILKKGSKYGIMHLTDDDQGEIPENLFLVTLFEFKENGTIRSWNYDQDRLGDFLETGTLEYKEGKQDHEIIMTGDPEKIIKALESNFDQIFDTENAVTVRKLTQPK